MSGTDMFSFHPSFSWCVAWLCLECEVEGVRYDISLLTSYFLSTVGSRLYRDLKLGL
jgi:hypothetical protein